MFVVEFVPGAARQTASARSWWRANRDKAPDAFDEDMADLVAYTGRVTGEVHDTRGAALALPLDERAELAAELLASLDGEPDEEVEAAWAAEIERRIHKVRAEGSSGREWNEIVGELRRDS